jgi:hypothetical protein
MAGRYRLNNLSTAHADVTIVEASVAATQPDYQAIATERAIVRARGAAVPVLQRPR